MVESEALLSASGRNFCSLTLGVRISRTTAALGAAVVCTPRTKEQPDAERSATELEFSVAAADPEAARAPLRDHESDPK
ncbi:hypothetical protein EGT50_09795 [Rhodococcus xishaensis]|uniref:Uncharacterized protein n=1 Tax=Rhodococcus xishaensis TaxID=2487364 RepID=A0A438AWA3_9NOCA|nr:hypothetical protein EGT50_09795 [Rhodococcus xishaensis]